MPPAARNLFEKRFLDFQKLLVGVVYEHIKVTSGAVEVCGEHIMADAGPLRLEPGFFGAHEAITNYAPGQTEWVATLIITGSAREQALLNRNRVIYNIEAAHDATLARRP
jgi:pyrrolysine biosynthesis protein PylC